MVTRAAGGSGADELGARGAVQKKNEKSEPEKSRNTTEDKKPSRKRAETHQENKETAKNVF